MRARVQTSPVKTACVVVFSMEPSILLQNNGNGLLFYMTQPISRSTIKAIACSIFFYLFVYSRHEVHSMNTHTLQNAG